MTLVDGMDEDKAVLIATTKCVCEYPPMQQSQELWRALRDAAVKRVEGRWRDLPVRDATCMHLLVCQSVKQPMMEFGVACRESAGDGVCTCTSACRDVVCVLTLFAVWQA